MKDAGKAQACEAQLAQWSGAAQHFAGHEALRQA